MSDFFIENMPMSGGGLGSYADIFSLGMSIVFAGTFGVLLLFVSRLIE